MNNLGNRLKKLRLQTGLTVSEVARQISVSISTYREWEYGRQIKGEPYEKLAEVLNVSLNELLTGQRLEIETHMNEVEVALKRIRSLL